MIYRVTNPKALGLYEPEIRGGIDVILSAVGRDDFSQDAVWDELRAHVTDFGDTAAVWLIIDQGLQGFISAKVFYDGPKITGAITWAWSQMHGMASPDVMVAVEDWMRERGCTCSMASRPRREDWFERAIGKYGYAPDSVVYKKELLNVDSQRSVGGEFEQHEPEGLPEPSVQPGSNGSDADALRSVDSGDHRADGESPGDGDFGAATAGDFQHPADDAESRGREPSREAVGW